MGGDLGVRSPLCKTMYIDILSTVCELHNLFGVSSTFGDKNVGTFRCNVHTHTHCIARPFYLTQLLCGLAHFS